MPKARIRNYPIGPFPVVLAGAEVDGKPGFATAGACGCVCLDPILYLSLKSTHHTNRGIKANGYFSINIPSSNMVVQTDYCGIVSGVDIDKSSVFTSFYDDIEKAPLITECPLNFLCKVIQSLPIHGFDVFFGEIVAAYADESCSMDGRPDPMKLHPLMIMGSNYWDLGKPVGDLYREGKAFPDSITLKPGQSTN